MKEEIDNFTKELPLKYDGHMAIDGIINWSLFSNAKYKVLWILKEAYGECIFHTNGEPHNRYYEYINNFVYQESFPTSGSMWYKITYTNYGILNGFQKWNFMDELYENEKVFNSLKSCALINLKKIPGETQSDYDEINHYYKKAKEIIHKQIALINPQIVICGGTFNIIKPDLKDLKKLDNDNLCFESNKKLFINAYHPSYYKMKQPIYCDEIISAVENWVNNRN